MNQQPEALGLRYYVHNAFVFALTPLLVPWWVWRTTIGNKECDDVGERMGKYPENIRRIKDSGDPLIWMHAVSVGEVAAAEAILGEVKRQSPLTRIVLSTTTQTGHNLAEKRALSIDGLIYLPVDVSWTTRRAIRAIRPDLLCTIDTELWPNLFAHAKASGARVAVANARFSDRALRRARPFRPIYTYTLGNTDAILAQSELDAERYRKMGAPAERIEVTGSVKFDEDFPEVSAPELAKLRQDLGLSADIPTLVVGSTREGEEALILEAFHRLRMHHHQAVQIVIAPRHPERGDEIEALVRERGYHPVRRSQMLAETDGARPQDPADTPQDSVLILDTIGELARVYALADIVVVGGSFIKWGGHNMLQPMAQGKPVIVGPHTHNFRDIVSICEAEEALVQISSHEQLADTIGRILSSPGETELLSVRALKVVRSNQGASERTARRLLELLNSP